jgi:hypothetical protein
MIRVAPPGHAVWMGLRIKIERIVLSQLAW